MDVNNISVFGGHDIPPIVKQNIRTEIQSTYDDCIFYKKGNPTPITIFLRSIIIGGPIILICFLMYQCTQSIQKENEIKYKKVAEQHNIEILEDQPKKHIYSVYQLTTSTYNIIDIMADYYYSDRLSNGKLHIKFYKKDSCGCAPFSEYTDIVAISKIKEGYP